MMKDDNQFDDVLRQAAQDYNRPPTLVPRDEMWAAIEASQAKRASRPLHIVAPGSHLPMRRYVWIGAAAAAVLLVAAGVGIGRWSTIGVPAVASRQQVAASSGTRNAGVQVPSVVQPETPTSPETESSVGGRARSTSGEGESSSRVERERGPRVASHSGGKDMQRGAQGSRGPINGNRLSQTAPSRGANGSSRQEVPYQVATIRHLANAEALLTAFRTDSRDAKMDAQLSKWARDLLSNTRLLLDSPAADDPQRAKLLGDLELVLAQIVQLSPGAAAQDRDLIEGGIQSGHVMTRLRSAIPAGPTRGI